MHFDGTSELIDNGSVAVVISGMIREWELCIESFNENFIKPNESSFDIDVFLVTYDVTDRYSDNRESKKKISEQEFNNLREQFNTKNLCVQNFDVNKQEILDYMNSIDNPPLVITTNHTQRDFLETIYMQSHLLKQSLNFINDKNKKYDCIMRTRFDILYDQKFIIPSSLMANSIYDLPYSSNQNFVDNCFLGDFESMKKILSSYDFLLENPNSTITTRDGFEFGPYIENLFLTNMRNNKIMPITNEQWKVSILRDKYNQIEIPRMSLYHPRGTIFKSNFSNKDIELIFPPDVNPDDWIKIA